MAQPAVEKVTVFSIANPEHAIASLRLIAPLSEAGIEISWRMPNQEYGAQMISGSDLVIIQRDFPRFVDQYIQIHLDAHRLGIPVIFEIDDLLWELPEEHPDRAANHYTDALLPMMFAALASDGITVSSTGIKQYLSWLNPNIFVLPNYLNLKLWSFQTPELNLGDTISIGYMGGDSHLPDLQMVEIVILDILESYQGRVKFINWGLQPPPALNEHPLVEWKSLTPGDYAAFAKHFNQHHFDIYIAPLKNSLFNRSKSSIKIFEYTTLGIPGVSSDLEPYSSVINPGVTGFLAETTEQWEAHLRILIDQPDIRNQIARQAQASVRIDWLMSDHFYQWQQVYESILGAYSPRQDVPEILQLMKSIIAQTTVREKQLKMKFDNQQAQLLQMKKSRSWQAGQVLRSIFNRLLSRKQKRPAQEVLDES